MILKEDLIVSLHKKHEPHLIITMLLDYIDDMELIRAYYKPDVKYESKSEHKRRIDANASNSRFKPV